MTSIAAQALGLDDFDLHARYRPGLLAVLPVPITAIAIGLDKHPMTAILLSLAVTVGLPRLLVQVVRDRGTAAQVALWTAWGGSPTTQMLRLSNTDAAMADKIRWRRTLAAAAQVHLPATVEVEVSDPVDADARCEQVTEYARELTRDDVLLQAENRSYNYERNLYSMRKPALLLAVAAIGGLVVDLALRARWGEQVGSIVFGLVANALVALGWIVLASERRVRVMADKYAHRLFAVATHRVLASTAAVDRPGDT